MTGMDWTDWMEHPERLTEKSRLTREAMTEKDIELADIWKCAFPDGLKHAQILQLIHLLYVERRIPARRVMHQVAILLGVIDVLLFNEVFGIEDTMMRDSTVQSWLEESIDCCGYYKWLANDGYFREKD